MYPVEVATVGLKEGFLLVRIVGEGADARDLGEVEDSQSTSPSEEGRLNLRARLEENAVTVMALGDTKGSRV